MENNAIEKVISDAFVVLINNPLKVVRAMALRLAYCPRVYTAVVTQTMAVDGVNLYINPHWTLAQSKIKILFVLLHEACHVWCMHSKRLRDCYPHQREVIHQAADYVVNLTLAQANIPYPVPDDALIDFNFVDDRGVCLNVERVVDLLLKNQQTGEKNDSDDSNSDSDGNTGQSAPGDSGDSQENTGTDSGGDSGNDGTDSDAESTSAGSENADSGDSDSDTDSGDGAGDGVGSNSQTSGCNDGTPDSCGDLLPAPAEIDERDHVRRNEQALQLAANCAGSMPSNLIEELHRQAQGCDTDWLTLFRDRFATAVDNADYSFSRFNEPYAAIGMIEPTLYSESAGNIAICIDESSSMDADALNKAAEQLAAIVAEWTPQRVLIIRHTSRIESVQELTYGQQPDPVGSRFHGGTSFNPVIQLLEDEMVEVACWVTDCYPCDRVRDTNVPIIWLGTEDRSEWAHQQYGLGGDFIAIH